MVKSAAKAFGMHYIKHFGFYVSVTSHAHIQNRKCVTERSLRK